jgi:hypothetical protein
MHAQSFELRDKINIHLLAHCWSDLQNLRKCDIVSLFYIVQPVKLFKAPALGDPWRRIGVRRVISTQQFESTNLASRKSYATHQ